jgi:hypothetical protein
MWRAAWPRPVEGGRELLLALCSYSGRGGGATTDAGWEMGSGPVMVRLTVP